MPQDLLEAERNPAQKGWEDTRDGANKPVDPTSDFGNIATNFNSSTADPTQENRNIAAAGEQTPAPSRPNTAKTKDKPEASSNVAPKSKRDKALTFMKKVTPFTVLLGIFVISMGGLLLINIPALVLVQIKEGAMGDMFDSLSVAELRTIHVFRAKTKPHPALAGGCTKVSVRCNIKSLSDNQLKKVRAAGLSTDPVDPKKNAGGRYKVKSFTYTDKSGQTRTVSARDFNKQYRTNPEFRNRINQAYNPKWKMLRDGAAKKVLTRFKVSLNRLIGGSKKAMRSSSESFLRKGTAADVERTGINQSRKPPNELDDAQKAQKNSQDIEARNKLAGMSNKSSGFKSTLKGGARAANILTGAQAQACAVIKSIEIAGTASRILKHAELLRLAVLVYNTADSIPYGEATYEAVDYVGNFVTSVDLQEEVISEDSFGDGDIVEAMGNLYQKEEEPKMVKNPDYGKSPTESVGQKASLYGSVGNLSMRDSQYVIGSGFQGSLKSLTDYLRENVMGALNKKTCAFYENLAVQTGGLLLSLGGVIATGGAGAGAATAKLAVQMAAFGFITSYINGIVSDMLTGEAVNFGLKGVDVGNALFAGGGAFYGAMSSSRGLTPVSTNTEVRNMQAMRTESLQQQAQVARYEARSEPLNIYNQYSFLGSIIWSFNPSTVQSLSRAGLALRTPSIILGSLTSLLSPKARAATISDEARFSKCQDPAFVGGGIRNTGSADNPVVMQTEGVGLNKADMMCNPRYSIDPIHSNADPERVADWMIDSGQVDNKTGEPIKEQPKMAAIYDAAGQRDDSQVDKASPRDGAPIEPGDVQPPSPNMTDEEVKEYLDATKGQSLPTSYNEVEKSVVDLPIDDVLRPDDQTLADLGIPVDTPSNKLVAYTPGYQAAKLASAEQDIIKNNQENGSRQEYLPPPIGANASIAKNNAYDPIKDVRTYAHWVRFCRFGDEDGRKVQIGDGDALDDKTGFTKLLLSGIDEEYVSDGRECLKSNTCTPGEDPNGVGRDSDSTDWNDVEEWDGEKAMRNRCRPPQYDIYSVYHMDKSIEDGLEDDESDESDNSNLADGDARELARQLADHEELSWQNGDITPNLLREFADKGTATNSCGESFVLDKLFLQVMLKQLDTYTIVGNNIGFSGDRSFCDGGMHPAGKAIDINRIEAREGSKKGAKTGPTITFGSSEEVDLITQFAIDWMDAAGTIDKKAGRSGQIGCGGYNLLNKRKPEWEGADGNLHFSDACNHLHIDMGQR